MKNIGNANARLQRLTRGRLVGSSDSWHRGVYAISVAAELVGTGQQNLRLYERKGLLEPLRTQGGTRRYNEADLVTLRRISELLSLRRNLSGIRLVLSLEAENSSLRHELNGHSAREAASQDGTIE